MCSQANRPLEKLRQRAEVGDLYAQCWLADWYLEKKTAAGNRGRLPGCGKRPGKVTAGLSINSAMPIKKDSGSPGANRERCTITDCRRLRDMTVPN